MWFGKRLLLCTSKSEREYRSLLALLNHLASKWWRGVVLRSETQIKYQPLAHGAPQANLADPFAIIQLFLRHLVSGGWRGQKTHHFLSLHVDTQSSYECPAPTSGETITRGRSGNVPVHQQTFREAMTSGGRLNYLPADVPVKKLKNGSSSSSPGHPVKRPVTFL